MTEKEKFIILASNDFLKKADVIVLLEGDGYCRVKKTVQLYKNKWAKKVVISGGMDEIKKGKFPAVLLRAEVLKGGVPAKDIILETKSKNTWEQAVEVVGLAKKKKWKRIILVVSHFHQYRAFLTFLKAIKRSGLKIEITNAPVRDLAWFARTFQGKRIDLLAEELKKIAFYSQKGHCATYKDALTYFKKNENYD